MCVCVCVWESIFSIMCKHVVGGGVSAGRWSERSPPSPQPPPLAQPAPLPPVLAPPSVGPLPPVPPHLPPYLAPTSQVVAPTQLKPLQMPAASLQPLSQVPAQVRPAPPLPLASPVWLVPLRPLCCRCSWACGSGPLPGDGVAVSTCPWHLPGMSRSGRGLVQGQGQGGAGRYSHRLSQRPPSRADCPPGMSMASGDG